MFASLPMYDLPELQGATDRWWQAIAQAAVKEGVREVPAALTRQRDPTQLWRRPDLLLTQTCGFPLTHAFAEHLRAIAMPHYQLQDCAPGHYRSAFMVHDTCRAQSLVDFRNKRLAANSPDSQSGFNCLRAAIAGLVGATQFFDEVIWTGSHRQSLAALAAGRADLAAIDAVTLALLQQQAPGELSDLRILAWSDAAPALPYATPRHIAKDLRQRLWAAIQRALADTSAKTARDTLLIGDFIAADNPDYAPIIAMHKDAQKVLVPNSKK